MFTLAQSQRIRGAAGKPLPTVFRTLAGMGVHFVRGQLVLISAGPGAGKSLFVLTKALKSKASTLYFSADSDAFTQLSRAVAIVDGRSLEDAKKLVLSDGLNGAAEKLDGIPLRMSYIASPTLGDLKEHLDAYLEVYGDYPSLIVVDNVTNVMAGTAANDEDPFAGLEGLMDGLHGLARETGACVVALHHVTGGYNNSDRPIPLDGVKGQITRVPEMVLTLYRPHTEGDGPGTLFVSAVKNRSGRADPTGRTAAELEFIGSHGTIRDYASA